MNRITQRLILAALVIVFAVGISDRASAQASVALYCWNPTGSSATNNQYTPCNGANPLVVSASVSASITGFPGSTQTTGTPISVTTGGVTGTLPAGTEVVVSNVGATNGAYCKLGASATTSDQLIPPNSWFGFTVGSNTQLTCITSTSTTTVNMVGGSGLPTGSGGGGGGSGGGGAVFGPTAAASPAANPPVLIGGTIDGTATGNVDNWKVASGLGYVLAVGAGTAGSASGGILTVQGVASMTPIASNITQVLGSAISATNGLFSNILQGNAALSATNGIYGNLLQGNAVLSQTNPIFSSITDGTNKAAVKPASTAAVATDPAVVMQLNPLSPGIIALGQTTKANSVPTATASDQLGPQAVANAFPYILSSQYPANAVTTSPTPLVAKGTGSTGAVTGTLTPASTATAYVCGFNVSYVGGTAQIGPLVLSGLLNGSFTYQIPLATATGGQTFSQTFFPCIPASAVNTPIVMTTVADGTATAVDVNIWGYGL